MHIESQIGVEHEHLWYNLQGCAPVLHMIQQKLLVETIILNNNFQYLLWSLHLTVHFFHKCKSIPIPHYVNYYFVQMFYVFGIANRVVNCMGENSTKQFTMKIL